MTNKIEDLKSQTEALCKEIIGYSFEEALVLLEKFHKKIRVTKRDGKNNIVTRDYRIDRVNLNIENNIVISAHVG